MTSALIEHYRSVISNAPGPAPWYLGQEPSDLSTPQVKLVWERDPNAGPTALMDRDRNIYALASMSVYVLRVSPARFVVWYKAGSPQLSELQLQLYDTSLWKPLTEQQACSARLKKAPFTVATPPLAQYSIHQSQPVGCHTVALPLMFADCPDLFILVSNDNTWDKVGLNLWTISPSRRQLLVASQEWFTQGSYDFGYQWVTRIARSPETGNLVGDGIRIGNFLLNEDGSQFLAWLTPD